MNHFCHHVERMFWFHRLIGPTSITAFVYWVSFITVWRVSVSIEFSNPASFIAFIESSLTRKLDIKIKAHTLRNEIIICITCEFHMKYLS